MIIKLNLYAQNLPNIRADGMALHLTSKYALGSCGHLSMEKKEVICPILIRMNKHRAEHVLLAVLSSSCYSMSNALLLIIWRASSWFKWPNEVIAKLHQSDLCLLCYFQNHRSSVWQKKWQHLVLIVYVYILQYVITDLISFLFVGLKKFTIVVNAL